MHCSNCGSLNLKNLGIRMSGANRHFKYRCNNCGNTQTADTSVAKPVYGQNYVITSATDGFPINKRFLKVLENYCKIKSAKLVILPVNNKQQFNEFRYDDLVKTYLVADKINLGDDVSIMGDIKLGTTLESPLSSMSSFSKGKTVIFGHPQVQLKCLPRKNEKYPPMMLTTGSVSIPNYTENKTAQKANFNHSFSAVFVSKDSPRMIRHLNYDGVGFFDLGDYYDETNVTHNNKISALVVGDEHVVFIDKIVAEATFGKGGMVDTLKPEYIVRHDVLDCYSISHHHKNNVFLRYGKASAGIDSIEAELDKTIKFISDTTPSYATSIVVPSNHNNHLFRWLNDCDPKLDLVNAKLYHKLMWMMFDNVKIKDGSPSYPDPFELYSRDRVDSRVRFLKPDDDFLVHDIDLNNHGDVGANGSRGSALQFKDLPNKTVIGHSHTPLIEKGVMQCGTTSQLRLEYNKGLSSWAHAQILVHTNGKRQMVFVVDGKWKD